MSKTTNNNNIKKDGNNMEKSIIFTFGETKITVNREMSFSHKLAFSGAVVENSYIDVFYSRLLANMAFDVLFMLNFSDYSFPDSVKDDSGDKIDIEKAYDHISKFNIREKIFTADDVLEEFVNQLEDDIKQRIAFENAKIISLYSRSDELKETYEGLNTLITTGTNFFNKAIEKLNLVSPALEDIVANPGAMENLITMFKGEANNGE